MFSTSTFEPTSSPTNFFVSLPIAQVPIEPPTKPATAPIAVPKPGQTAVPTAAPIFAFAAVIALLFAVSKFRFQKYLSIFLVVLLSSEVIFASVNSFKINKEYKNLVENLSNQKNQVSQDESKNLSKIYNFSKTQKNVVVLFLDRAIPTLFPYIFKEFPELNEVFSGFTLFPNSVSYSSSTIKASPALMGGYEYTPENINKRPDELLKDKHNEATLVMPKLFSDAGYDVSVANLPLPNYTWHGDLSAYKKVPEVKVYETGKNILLCI